MSDPDPSSRTARARIARGIAAAFREPAPPVISVPSPLVAAPGQTSAPAEESTTAMLVSLAQARLDAQLQAWHSWDMRTFWLIAGNAALLGLVLVYRDLFYGLLWIPVLGFLAVIVVFYGSLRTVDLSPGPDLEAFYAAFGQSSTEEVRRAMLDQLLAAIAENEQLAGRRRRTYAWGEGLMVAMAALAVLIALLAY